MCQLEAETKCPYCTSQVVFYTGEKLVKCHCCTHYVARPKSSGEALKMFTRAHELREAQQFEEAAKSYQLVLNFFPKEHEALWGLVLSQYGVTFVRDKDGKMLPTCRLLNRKPMQEQYDFNKACEMAPEEEAAE